MTGAPPAMPDPRREMLSLVTARVRDAFVRKPVYVDGAQDLVAVCRELSARGATSALVRDGTRLGIFTTTDLRDALLRDVPPAALAVREVARFDIVEVQADSEVFEALWLMVKHRVHRLVVRDGDAVLGVLGQLDLVSFVAHHSHVVALQIDEATTLPELQRAAASTDEMVALLHGSGIRVERIAHLVCELNARLFARTWALLAPPALVQGSCLLVMGSEGRGEQILKTDQDNALLLRDGFDALDAEAVAAVATRFSAALADFGYPPCRGGVMLSNPPWRQELAAFRETLRGWLMGGSADGPMQLAIFADAAVIAGDASLLVQARTHLDDLLAGNDLYLSRFAAAANQFQEPVHWFSRLTRRGRHDTTALDLKKLGIFPIVHGVRALALQHHVRELGTAARIDRLVAAGQLDATLARDLLDTLHFLMALRLKHQLAQRAAGQLPDDTVLPAALPLLEREPLRDALALVQRWRSFLVHHFRLDAS